MMLRTRRVIVGVFMALAVTSAGAGSALADYCDDMYQQTIDECNRNYPGAGQQYERQVCFKNANDWYQNCLRRTCGASASTPLAGKEAEAQQDSCPR